MGIGVVVGNAVRAVGVDVGVAAVVALMLSETVASMLGGGTGVCVRVVVGVGVAFEIAVGDGSKGKAVGCVDSVHAVSDTSSTKANAIKVFLYQVMERPPILLQSPGGTQGDSGTTLTRVPRLARGGRLFSTPDYSTPATKKGPQDISWGRN